MPTVAFINNGFPEGGVARVTLDIARYARTAAPSYRIIVLASRIVESMMNDEIRSLVQLIQTDDPVRKAREIHADILVECSWIFKGTEKTRAAGTKIVFANHGEAFHEMYSILDHRQGGHKRHWWNRVLWNLYQKKLYTDGGKALRLAQERAARNYAASDAYVVLCEGYRRQTEAILAGQDSGRLWVINNPEYPVEHPTLQKEKLILFCGRLCDYDKKPERLLRIWRQVQHQLPDYRLALVGDGDERPRLEALAREWKLERCSFEGRTSHPETWYRKADILCLVSQTEGWPLCLTEALAHGVIPVAFNCSAGVEEILSRTGFLVPHPDEEAFARTLVDVARRSDEEKMMLRQAGIERVAELAPDRIGARWIALFNAVLA